MFVCRVKFKEAGKRYFFSTNDLEIENKMQVVVETTRGMELGTVVGSPIEQPENLKSEIKPIKRIATTSDIEKSKSNALEIEKLEPSIIMCVKKHAKDVKYITSEFTLDRHKLVVYFQSEDRIDFRELVKDLADKFKIRIELRQVGAREGAKMLGGIGPCGLAICCKNWIGEFENVSIKMAKNQNLSLNPQKISGLCTKLLCCIKYENDLYDEYRKTLPDLGEIVKTENGNVKITGVDVLRGRLKGKNLTTDTYITLEATDITGYSKER